MRRLNVGQFRTTGDCITGELRGCRHSTAGCRTKEELYDLVKDPYEMHNLANDPAYAGVLRKHQTVFKQWRIETNDRIPEVRTLDEFDRITGGVTPARIRPRPSKAEMMKKLSGH